MYPPPPFCGPIHHSPGFPYNVGAVPEFTSMPTSMPGIRPPPMGMPMHPGLSHVSPGMFYGYHPGMAAPQMAMGHGAMTPGMHGMEGLQPPTAGRPSGGSALAPASQPKPIGGHGGDSRKDVRFAGASAAPPRLTPRR